MRMLLAIVLSVLANHVAATGDAMAATQSAVNLQSGTRTLKSADAITIPQMLSYQGKLTDTFGLPVADTTYSVEFRLYTVPSGGAPCWSEAQTVRTSGGLFSVLLGSATPIGSVPNAGTVYLSMNVSGGTELAPRLRIVSAAYAYKADTANYALASAGGGGDNAWVRGSPDSVLFTIRNLGIARGGAASMLHGANRHTHVNLGVACTTGTPGQNFDYATVGGGSTNAARGSGTVVAGGSWNTASGITATVAGGTGNDATANGATVAGGAANTASGPYSFVGGGADNTVPAGYAVVSGGYSNSAQGYAGGTLSGRNNLAGDAANDTGAVVCGGSDNQVAGRFSTIGGGRANGILASYATITGGDSSSMENATCGAIGGGRRNYVHDGGYSTVSGGYSNTTGGSYDAIGGGLRNESHGSCAVVAGGDSNTTMTSGHSVVSGGSNNYIDDPAAYAVVGGGRGDSVRALYGAVGGGYSNSAGDGAADTAAVVAGGWNNTTTGKFNTIGGGYQNNASNSYSTIAGGRGNTASGNAATVAGGEGGRASGLRSVVGGGYGCLASNDHCFVGGGYADSATGLNSVVTGGEHNSATLNYATVGGGRYNAAHGWAATVAGGTNNAAGGYAIVPGGIDCHASGNFSFAAGSHAKARGDGSFVWSDSCATADSVRNTTDNRWVARARGGVYFYTNLGMTTGSYLSSGGSSWNSVSDSMTKENFRPVDKQALLEALARMRVRDYNLKSQDASIRHIGPVAQDFHNTFGFGESNTAINMEDADGVLLAAVQALYDQNQAQQAEIEALKEELKRR